MSNYQTKACRPHSIFYENVIMLDNYYGHHEYGVEFPDGKVYPEEKCAFKREEDGED